MITLKKNASRGFYFGEWVRPDAVRESFFKQYFELFLKYRDFIMADAYYRNILATERFCGYMYYAAANCRATLGELFRMWANHPEMHGKTDGGDCLFVTHYGGSPLSGRIFGFETRRSAISLSDNVFCKGQTMSDYTQIRRQYIADGEVERDVRALVALAIGLQYNEDKDARRCEVLRQILEQESLPPIEDCLSAIRENKYWFFLMLEQQTPELALEVVKLHPEFIEFITPENRTEEVWNEMLDRNAKLFRFAKKDGKHITWAMMEKAARLYGDNIEFWKDAPEDVCLSAVKQNPHSIRFINKPSDALRQAAFEGDASIIKYLNDVSDEMNLESVKRDWQNLRYVKRQTPEICRAALEIEPGALQYVRNQTEEMCLEAIRRNPKMFTYVKTEVRTPLIIQTALELHPKNFAVLNKAEQTPELCKEIVDKQPLFVKYIRDDKLKEQFKQYAFKQYGTII